MFVDALNILRKSKYTTFSQRQRHNNIVFNLEKSKEFNMSTLHTSYLHKYLNGLHKFLPKLGIPNTVHK